MSDNLPERVQILGHAHIICITAGLLKSAFERIFNVMQLILVKITEVSDILSENI